VLEGPRHRRSIASARRWRGGQHENADQTAEWSRRNSFPRPQPEPKVYSPRLRRDQIRALYYLKRFVRRPMTKLAQEAVDRYLAEHGGVDHLIRRGVAELGDARQDPSAR
jgi:hypothetical protein